jgi:hypothetical protein
MSRQGLVKFTQGLLKPGMTELDALVGGRKTF